MKFFPLASLIFFLAASAAAQNAPWIGDNKQGFDLALQAGAFGDGIHTYGINGEYHAPWRMRVGLALSSVDGEPSASTATNVYVSSDPQGKYVGQLSYDRSRQDMGYNSSDIKLSGGWNFRSWYFEASYVNGDLILDSDQVDPVILARLADAGYLSAKRGGFGLGATYFADAWAIRVAYADYQYKRDRTFSDANVDTDFGDLTVAERIALIQNLRDPKKREHFSRFFRYVSQRTYNNYRQATPLADAELNIDYTRMLSDTILGIGYSWTDQVLEGDAINTLYMSGDYEVSKSTTFGCLMSTSDYKSAMYAELNVSYSW